MNLIETIRTIPDYPRPGIMFRATPPRLGTAEAFAYAVDQLCAAAEPLRVDKVAGIEARGFILGGAGARRLGAGFVPLRKKGKLPHRTRAVEYALEYGQDAIEMHLDACGHGERVLLLDDLIATGGTAGAAMQLLAQSG